MHQHDDDLPDFSTRVRDFVGKFEPFDPRLPFTHICPMYAFRGIITGEVIRPTKCDVYEEDLIYLFYGRPAYRVNQSASHRLPWSVPILFVFDPEKTFSLRRIMPFDSGAFAKGMYGKTFADRSRSSDFELEPELESAQRLVTGLYGGNKEYYRGETNKILELSDFDFELQGIQYLAQQPGQQMPNSSNKLDERASAVEIQISNEINIGEATLALFVPETLITNRYFQAAARRWKVEDKIETFSGIVGAASDIWVGQLYERVRSFYLKHGYM